MDKKENDPLNLSLKLVISIGALSILGLFGMYILMQTVVRNAIYENAIGLHERETRILASEVEGWLDKAQTTMETLETVLCALPSYEGDFFPVIEGLTQETGFIDNIFVATTDGHLVNGRAWVPPDGWDVFSRPWYIAAMGVEPNEVAITEAFWSQSRERTVIAMSMFSPELGEVGTVIGFSITLNYLLSGIGDLNVVGDGYLILVENEGQVLIYPDRQIQPGPDVELFSIGDIGGMVAEVFAAGQSGVPVNDHRIGNAYLFSAQLESAPWTLIAVIPAAEISGPVARTLTTIILSILAVLVALFAFTMFFTSSIVRAAEKSREKERDTQERWNLIYAKSPIAVSFWDKNINLVDFNDVTYQMAGLSSREEYIKDPSKTWTERQPSGLLSLDQAAINFRKTFEEGYLRFIWTCVDPEGDVFPIECTLIRLIEDGEFKVAAYWQDLRPAREYEAKITRAEEENRAKSRFLAHMSHEIRTPMNAVLGITEIQLQKEKLPPDLEEAFLRIHSSSNLLLTIINDILDLSKVEADKMEIIPAAYDVADMIIDTIQLNMIHIGDKQIDFVAEANPNLPAQLIGDEQRVKQILNNLLSNAFKYTNEGSVKLIIDTERSDDDVHLLVKICDTGPGLTQEEIEVLFQNEFTRFNEEKNRTIEGTGLGMTIAHRLASLMDGNISVESKPGAGTTFTVTLPQKMHGTKILGANAVKNLTRQKTKKIKKISRNPMPHGRVLVVDDVESNLYVAKNILLSYKINAKTLTSGEDAVKKIKAGAIYDIIFMDHMMPGMDGMEAARLIRESGYTRPIVALTANLVGDIEGLFLKSGFDACLTKPMDMQKFDECLKKFIPKSLEGGKISQGDGDFMIKHLNTIIEACTKFDIATADNSLEILRHKRHPDNHVNELISDITASLLYGDMRTAKAIAAMTIAKLSV
ncbi:MAG: ATP-binding protein [Defluviitaleaceae bacterium]|nr:ATP-binding protein [Defluviitaleaceae bacterium]